MSDCSLRKGSSSLRAFRQLSRAPTWSPASSLNLLGLDLRSFFGAPDRQRTFDGLAHELRALLAHRTLDDLEEEVGWELGAQLAEPERFADLPLCGLEDVARAVGADWREFLPPRRM